MAQMLPAGAARHRQPVLHHHQHHHGRAQHQQQPAADVLPSCLFHVKAVEDIYLDKRGTICRIRKDDQLYFRMSKTTKFHKVKSSFAERFGVDPASLSFTFAGALIKDEDTAEVLHLRSDDVILVRQAMLWLEPTKLPSTRTMDFASMLDAHDLCDIELVCNPDRERLKAHKAVLAARSGKFAGMFRSTDMLEGNAAAIEQLNVDKATMECILNYIYTDSCDVPKDFEPCVTLLAAAEEYLLPPLKRECELQLVTLLSATNACRVLQLADLHTATYLKSAALRYILEHFEQVQSSSELDELQRTPHLLLEVLKDGIAAKRQRLQ